MIFVDAHVHIYDCFDLETFLNSALANFKAEALRLGRGNGFTAILLLTETAKENWFHRLAGNAGDAIFMRDFLSTSHERLRIINEEACSKLQGITRQYLYIPHPLTILARGEATIAVAAGGRSIENKTSYLLLSCPKFK